MSKYFAKKADTVAQRRRQQRFLFRAERISSVSETGEREPFFHGCTEFKKASLVKRTRNVRRMRQELYVQLAA